MKIASESIIMAARALAERLNTSIEMLDEVGDYVHQRTRCKVSQIYNLAKGEHKWQNQMKFIKGN